MSGKTIVQADNREIVTYAPIRYVDSVRGEIILPPMRILHGVRMDNCEDYIISDNEGDISQLTGSNLVSRYL